MRSHIATSRFRPGVRRNALFADPFALVQTLVGHSAIPGMLNSSDVPPPSYPTPLFL
jgi:hypothetical protein